MKPKLKTFTIMFDIKSQICIEVKAETMEAALTEAKTYKPQDVYDPNGDVNYDEIEVAGCISNESSD